MNNIVYLKEPGILYDMLFALKLRFNGERAYIQLRTDNVPYEQNENFYKLIIERLSNIPDKLLCLFYCNKEKNIKTALVSHIRKYVKIASNPQDGLIERFYDSLRDINRLKQTIYKNYVSENSPDIFDVETICSIKDELFNADLPSDVKMYIFYFLMYGDREIEEIISELRKVEALCREFNQIHQNEIKQLVKDFESKYINLLSSIFCKDITQFENIYVSCCSVLVVANSYESTPDTWVSLLGINSEPYLSLYDIDSNVEKINLYELGRVLYDEQRIKILNMLAKEDMFCAQIAKELGLKNNSTLYHLNMLEKSGLTIHTKQGKFVYYSINSTYFNTLKKHIEKFF